MQQLLLDTNAFHHRQLLKVLKEHVQEQETQVFVNSVIYLELGFIFLLRQKYYVFEQLLRALDARCRPITENTARIAIKNAVVFKDDSRGAQYFFRDCLIGACAKENGFLLITNNTKDFPYLDNKIMPQEYLNDQKI